jgi:hypothetical protein
MMSVVDNIAQGLKRRGTAKADINRRVADMLERVGLPDVGQRKPDQLSGGQKQRIAIARCLDNSLVEAVYDLGGSYLSVLRDIVIPHTMPGIVSGSIVFFMLSLGNYLTPVLLGGKDSLWFTEQIFTQFITRFNWEQGAAFGVLLLVLSSLIVWAALKLSG